MRNAEEGNTQAMVVAWQAWVAEIARVKQEKELEEQKKAIQDKLAGVQGASKEKAKGALTRMTAGNDQALTLLIWQSWVAWLVEYKKDKELEDQVKAAEKQVQEYLKSKSDEAKGVLDRMSSGSDSGLIAMMMQYWIQIH